MTYKNNQLLRVDSAKELVRNIPIGGGNEDVIHPLNSFSISSSNFVVFSSYNYLLKDTYTSFSKVETIGFTNRTSKSNSGFSILKVVLSIADFHAYPWDENTQSEGSISVLIRNAKSTLKIASVDTYGPLIQCLDATVYGGTGKDRIDNWYPTKQPYCNGGRYENSIEILDICYTCFKETTGPLTISFSLLY